MSCFFNAHEQVALEDYLEHFNALVWHNPNLEPRQKTDLFVGGLSEHIHEKTPNSGQPKNCTWRCTWPGHIILLAPVQHLARPQLALAPFPDPVHLGLP